VRSFRFRQAARFAFLGTLAFVQGCVSVQGPSYSESQHSEVKPSSAIVYIFRENALPWAVSVRMDIDGEEVVALPNESFTWVYLKPGDRTISQTWPGLSGQKPSSMRFTAEAGQIYYVEVTGISRIGGYAPGLIGGIATLASIEMGSGFGYVPSEQAVPRVAKCCKFQKPPKQDF
jgi:hypothetical protein